MPKMPPTEAMIESALHYSPYRSQLLDLLRATKPVSGAEVGVHRGKTSAILLKKLPTLKNLLMVDLWEKLPGCDILEEQEYRKMAKEYTEFADRWRTIMHMSSLEAAETVKNKTLDFAFLDASHDEQDVEDDLEAWYPKVRPGGLLLVHDYGNINSQSTAGVQPAVDRFGTYMDLEVNVGHGFLAWFEVPE